MPWHCRRSCTTYRDAPASTCSPRRWPVWRNITNIVAIKEATGSLQQGSEVIALCGDKINVFSGDDFITFPMMACGAVGIISVLANIMPKTVADLVDAFFAGDLEKARQLHLDTLKIGSAMFIESNPVPVKTALELMGKASADVRLPLCELGDGEQGEAGSHHERVQADLIEERRSQKPETRVSHGSRRTACENVFRLVGLLVALLLVSGCATGTVNSVSLRRLDDVAALPKDARIGMTGFTVCGGSYLDKLNLDYHEQDAKAIFYHRCTELGHPQTFSRRVQLRLEERLGRKLVTVKTDKPFKPKLVLSDADKLGLEYVIAGDLLYMGEADNKTVVSALFYLIRVADRKIVVVGRVKKDGAIGKVLKVIDDVADELFATAYEN